MNDEAKEVHELGKKDVAPPEEKASAAPSISARTRHQQALLASLERTRNDKGQVVTTSAMEMRSKLSLVVTLDGIYTAPRYDMVVKEKKTPVKFYPSENAGMQRAGRDRHMQRLNRYMAHWQNSMEAAEGPQVLARPRHTLERAAGRNIAQRRAPKDASRSPEKEKNHER